MGDVLEEIRDPFGMVSVSYKTVYGFVPKGYKRGNYNARLRRALKTGFIEKIIKNGEPYLRLTSQGIERVKRDFPLLALRKRRWDGKWRVVVFDIAESERRVRTSLRRKLLELGFGMMQKSVWISPQDVAEDLREYLETHGLGDFVFVLVAHRLFAGDEKKLAAKVWRLDKINEEYQKILEKGIEVVKLKGKERDSALKQLRTFYFETVIIDPCLPKELLPEDWQGDKVQKLFKSHSNS